jgi:peptide/nickel transport system substrate-binding protein
MNRRDLLAGLTAAAACPGAARAFAESAYFAPAVAQGTLPDVAGRLPKTPRIVNLAGMGRVPGRHGGTIRMLIGGQRDIRYLPINSYSRLVGYDTGLELHPDILVAYEVEEERIFTFHLREGHRWSDGHPLTAEDFRYCWEDMILHPELGGVQRELLADGQPPVFEIIDPLTVRYSWPSPIPDFLPNLAAPVPLRIVLPAHYLRQFHADYQTPEALAQLVETNRVDDWTSLHQKMSRQNRPENPDLPTLEAWRPRTAPPAQQFVFERNPYFHRVDENGLQLPYADRMVMNLSSYEIIAAKTATGESDLQVAGIDFTDFTLLKNAEKRYGLRVSLWKRIQGSRVALYPNLNCADPVWRALFRDVRVRRALSLAIDRAEINKVQFFGLGNESADTLLPESPLWKPGYAAAWARHDPDLANALLDEAGLSARDAQGVRLLSDGRPFRIVVDTAGESTFETDVLELIADHFRAVGAAMAIRASQRDLFRSRVVGGQVVMAVWTGIDNGVATADMSPAQLAPTADDQLQWPAWGAWYLSGHQQGEPPDLPEAIRLVELLEAWRLSGLAEDQARIWHEMLAIHADQVFSIGTVNGALQPIVRSARLRNLPDKGLFGFAPTSMLGIYMPDTFWFEAET